MRLILPGVEVLFAFLLILPFTQRFAAVTGLQRDAFFGAFLCSALAGLALLALAVTGVVFLIADVLFGGAVSAAIAAALGGAFVWLWFGWPLSRRLRDRATGPRDGAVTAAMRCRDGRMRWPKRIAAALPGVPTLLLVEFAADLSPRQSAWVARAQQTIWAIFALEFAVQFILAPRKLRFLRGHWLAAIAVLLPALRVFRALRAARGLRSLRLVRLLGGTNRAMKALREMLRGRQFGYLVALTLLVVALGTAGIYVLERDQPGAVIVTIGDALWWASCLVTTINNEKYAISPEGRILAVLLRIYAVAIFGLITANIASFLVGRRQEEARAAGAPELPAAVAEELRRLREEVWALAAEGASAPAAGAPSAGPSGRIGTARREHGTAQTRRVTGREGGREWSAGSRPPRRAWSNPLRPCCPPRGWPTR